MHNFLTFKESVSNSLRRSPSEATQKEDTLARTLASLRIWAEKAPLSNERLSPQGCPILSSEIAVFCMLLDRALSISTMTSLKKHL